MNKSYYVSLWPFGHAQIINRDLSLICCYDNEPAAAIAFSDRGSITSPHFEILDMETIEPLRRKGLMTELVDLLRSCGISPILTIDSYKEYDTSLAGFLHGYCMRERMRSEDQDTYSIDVGLSKTTFVFQGDKVSDGSSNPLESLMFKIR